MLLPPAKRGTPRGLARWFPEAERSYGGHTYQRLGFTQEHAEHRADKHIADVKKWAVERGDPEEHDYR